MREQTYDLAKSLRLHGMAEGYRHQALSSVSRDVDFETRFFQLLQAEDLARSDSKRHRLLRDAKFRMDARPEDYKHYADREIDKLTMNELFTGQWVADAKNVVISGATGSGKTWIACCLGHVAIRSKRACLFQRASLLVEALESARIDGSLPSLRRKLVAIEVLIIDDFALKPLSEQAQEDLFNILEPRFGNKSTILVAQRAFAEWPTYITNALIADAIMDRFIPRSIKLELKGDSKR
jgi:DNA replication protein DnaC